MEIHFLTVGDLVSKETVCCVTGKVKHKSKLSTTRFSRHQRFKDPGVSSFGLRQSESFQVSVSRLVTFFSFYLLPLAL